MKLRQAGTIQKAINDIGTHCGWDRVADVLGIGEKQARKYGDPAYGFGNKLDHDQKFELIELWNEHSGTDEFCPISMVYLIAGYSADDCSINVELQSNVITIGRAFEEFQNAISPHGHMGSIITPCEKAKIAEHVESMLNSALKILSFLGEE